jgi:hypothetical protein
VALGGIEDDRIAVEEEMAAEDLVDVIGGDTPAGGGRCGGDACVQALTTTLSEGG